MTGLSYVYTTQQHTHLQDVLHLHTLIPESAYKGHVVVSDVVEMPMLGDPAHTHTWACKPHDWLNLVYTA